ncbi:MAG: response regulator [Paracoccaceae bacterium]
MNASTYIMRPIIQDIEEQLPYLRRYARAMSGSRDLGDRIAEQALIRFLRDDEALSENADLRVVLFRALQDARGELDYALEDETASKALAQANRHLSRLTPGSRDAFLLSAFEQFSTEQIATIMRRTPDEIDGLITVARQDLSNMITGRILVIEDELAVANEISEIVVEMGHSVIGNAPTKEDALEIVEKVEPDLILSDIQLANGGSGITAVSEILRSYPMTPVVYITGFPERLLTGKGPEPAFLVTKPYSPEQVRSAVSQAMFFA